MIYVGTCGFAYKDWIGPFYPGSVRRDEMLSFYAGCFGAVEIDSSAYGIPSARTVAVMNARTPGGFRFCFKVPKTLTHPPGGVASRVHDDAAAFIDCVMPIVQARKFGCALLQFPNGFKPSSAGRAYLELLLDALRVLPLAVEFRNREWQTGTTHALLREAGVGWCNVDMPAYESLMLPSSDVTGSAGYVRFHGRNAAQWWNGDNTTRYDYDYLDAELVPWSDRVAEIAGQAESTYAFFNNHARGNAARNARAFASILQARYGEYAGQAFAQTRTLPVQGELFDD